jgi:CheY-like chemotaxis protein
MSHEIRTPLNGVLGMLDLVLESGVSSGQREYLEVAERSAGALLRVINDILDFSKIEAGKLQLDPIPFALRNEAIETVRTFAVLAHEKGLELVCRIDPDVPDGLVGDIVRVRQVLTNLIGNAIKFTDAGEIELRVDRTSDAGEGTMLHFAVRDTGIGIAAEKCDIIFAAFMQADPSTTRRYGGTGLGLSISARLVQLMGGRIWLESEPGRGSTFHFTARFDSPRSNREDYDDARLLPLRGVPVLIADDNRTSLDILRGALERWGMAPTAVASGLEACRAAERASAEGHPFQLVILDGQMPGMNGHAVAQRILREWPHDRLSILMLAASPVPAEIHRYRDLGVHTVLMKPVRQGELRDCLLQALRNPDNRSEAA